MARSLLALVALFFFVGCGGNVASDDSKDNPDSGTHDSPGDSPDTSVSGCRSNTDCQADPVGMICIAPGEANCPPAAPQCTRDADCAAHGAGSICNDDPCGAKCVAGCTSDTECAVATACAPTHHCTPKSCSADADCGSGNFTCSGGSCARRTCTTDGQCEGACVKGACYPQGGTCEGGVA